MVGALTPPFAVAAIVLCVAGVAKLRSPAAAVSALMVLGAPASPLLVRALALLEIALGAASLAFGGAVAAAALGCVYGAFGGVSLLLARRRSACGCFGERDAPASVGQSAISACLALVGFAAAIWPAHDVWWLVSRPGPGDAALLIGTVGAAYAVVLAYTALPRAWSAWAGASG